AAEVEFSAEEYSPSRDFEVRIETAPSAGNIVLIPHRRGDDGTFMVLLSTKDAGEGRGLLPDGEPLDLLIIADTSGSMTDAQLSAQRAFIASLLESLGPKDRFNLLAFDVTAVWAFPDRVPVDAGTRERALDFIERRGALGWTDLELAFQEAMARARSTTHVVYVGDGIVTKGDADPVVFAENLKRMYGGQGSFHAVGVGSSYDLTSLRAIASLGQGSLHRGGSGKDECQMAAALLEEIATPGLRDIELAWDGIRVARVYPEILPNLPKGKEQFILGRYLVEDREQTGKLRVTGTLDGKAVSYEIPIAFPKADAGNSFIPRFWARMHLDYLLEQGRDPENIQKIIALSEDYQIITPYTSFLVLESDADRERFQVRKRFRMRGGEEFFAEGREAADYELARQQMLAAKLWRQNLRARFLQLYDGLGRGLMSAREIAPEEQTLSRRSGSLRVPGAGSGPMDWSGEQKLAFEANGSASYWFRDGADLFAGRLESFSDKKLDAMAKSEESFYAPFMEGAEELRRQLSADYGGLEEASQILELSSRGTVAAKSAAGLLPSRPATAAAPVMAYEGFYGGYGGRFAASEASFGRFRRGISQPPFTGLFPSPGGAIPAFEGKWPEEIRRIIERCNRRAVLSEMRGGLRVAVETDSIDARDRIRPTGRARCLIAPAAWAAVRNAAPTDIPRLEWFGEGVRGALDLGRLLGSRRKAQPRDGISYPSPFEQYFDWIEGSYGGHIPSLAREGDIAILTLVPKIGRGVEVRFRIDTRTSAVIEAASFSDGKPIGSVTFGEFITIGGATFPQRIERRDADGKVRTVTRIAYQALDGGIFADEMAKALAPIGRAIILSLPLPKLADAKTRAKEGEATLEDRWVLVNHFAATQRWDDVKENAAAVEALAEGKPGAAWIRLEVFLASRRNEEARLLALEMAKALAGTPCDGDFGLATALYQKASAVSQHLERLELLETLAPVFGRPDPRLEGMKTY
ncbi:MAG: VWA domain-containing protein, partial [Planctomycetes bacterium]|nr:VWA domain-containing protein [Planctomycetota bacterium]